MATEVLVFVALYIVYVSLHASRHTCIVRAVSK